MDARVPAISASLIMHVLLFLFVASITYAVSTGTGERTLEGAIEPVASLEDFAKLEPSEIASIDNTTIDPSAGLAAPDLSPRILETPIVPPSAASAPASTSAAGEGLAQLRTPSLSLDRRFALPSASRLGDSAGTRGTGSERVGDAEDAVDRVAVEILRRLEGGRTLVVWALDASGSLQDERQRLSKYVAGVYEHIHKLDQDKLAADQALLSAVVAFGQQRKVMVEPTDDAGAIAQAIGSVPQDDTGYESTFQTVIDVAKKYGRFSKEKESYRPLLVIVTDEVGDDEDRVEAAIVAARNVEMPVFVLGSPALFGRLEGYVTNYKDPKTGQRFDRVPVRAGPESARPEGIRLPFWYEGPQHEYLDSGFGPWALSRLARQTGGIAFITRMGPSSRLHFDPSGMKEYAPDWDSEKDYMARIGKSALRQGVLAAALATQGSQPLPDPPGLVFPPAGTEAFKEQMSRNQENVALVANYVDLALQGLTTPAAQAARKSEPSRRWQAHYDLALGRLMAVRVRCIEYNQICAEMKRNPPSFKNPKSNAWRLVADSKIRTNPKLAAAGDQARQLLEQVRKDHPGTPWALLAERELKDPLGFRWEETYIPPPPPPREPNPNDRPATPPGPPPKPPRI
jgi:uncharacterized protein YegL